MPVVTVVGPRQSGKSTVCRAAFRDHTYVNLERPDLRATALEDPRALLARGPVVFDEAQLVPSLLSWVQAEVDEDPRPGRVVLTGSNQLALSSAVAQSLAGRTAIRTLLPPDLSELRQFARAPQQLWPTVWAGAYPRIHDVGIPPSDWLAAYVATYVERDVRQVLRVVDGLAFSTFLRLAAGRTGQEVNLAALGADAGVTQPTARAWLSVLESSFLVHRLPAWHRNTTKQLVKAPKIHFVDTGLAAWLLGARAPDELFLHPTRGALFESWVVGEILKARLHRGFSPRIFHWRETRGVEVDLVVDDGPVLWLIEVKSGATVASDWFGPLAKAASEARTQHPNKEVRPVLVVGGDEPSDRHGVRVVPWFDVPTLVAPPDG